MKIRTFDYFVTLLFLSMLILSTAVNADELSETIWHDPDALIREAFRADEEPKEQKELEKHLHAHTVKILIKKGQVDEALEYAQKHDVLKSQSKNIVWLFVNALVDEGRFDKAIELALTIPTDNLGNGSSSYLQTISFRQAQCARFDDAIKTTSFITDIGNWKWSAESHIKDEERRCSLLKDGKPLRNFDGTLNDKSTTFSFFTYDRYMGNAPKEPLVTILLYYSDYKSELVDAIRKTKEKKNDEAKKLFDKVVEDNPYKDHYSSGARTEGERLCGIAAIQFELGHSDWAAETLSKIDRLDFHFGNNEYKDPDGEIIHFVPNYQIRLGHAIADVQLLLGDLDGMEKTLQRYFKLTDNPMFVCTKAWGNFAQHLATIGKQKEAVVILNRILDLVKSIEPPQGLSEAVNAVLLAAHELKDDETKKKIFERAKRYVAMRNNRTYNETYLAVVEGYICEKKFVDALRFMGHDNLYVNQQKAFIMIIEAVFQAGLIDDLKRIQDNTGNDLTPRVLVARRIARLAYDAGNMEEAKREIELAIALTRNINFHRMFDSHQYMLDIAEDLRYFRQQKQTKKISK
ncbi:MAG: hypothetical protein LBK06_03820 [Planctomycetaceae bacterium]|jgi:tetratricopeptide (TPR) repeat protein|nr:hypothetical protein [Planctomycetaceae bacterium]